MAFLDNSGDIILDAVLTDTGRMRLAKGDGSFKITKFAFGDDEINYTLYDKNNASGSAYYDLQILQTPVLEAFTNNASSLKSKLMSIARTDLLFLPVIEQNTIGGTSTEQFVLSAGAQTYIILADKNTVDTVKTANTLPAGVQDGNKLQGGGAFLRVDQGLDTNEISRELTLDPELLETQYLIEADNRLGTIFSSTANSPATVSFIDDDNIATYYLTVNTDSAFVTNLNDPEGNDTPIAGPQGTKMEFRLGSSTSLKTNDYLFNTLGTAGTETIGSMDASTAGQTYRFIDTMVSIVGVTTGYRIDLPIRYVKQI
jgi:hypothetical protein